MEAERFEIEALADGKTIAEIAQRHDVSAHCRDGAATGLRTRTTVENVAGRLRRRRIAAQVLTDEVCPDRSNGNREAKLDAVGAVSEVRAACSAARALRIDLVDSGVRGSIDRCFGLQVSIVFMMNRQRRPLPSMYGWMNSNMKWPSTARTAADGSSRSSSNRAGTISRTASRSGGTCLVDVFDPAPGCNAADQFRRDSIALDGQRVVRIGDVDILDRLHDRRNVPAEARLLPRDGPSPEPRTSTWCAQLHPQLSRDRSALPSALIL